MPCLQTNWIGQTAPKTARLPLTTTQVKGAAAIWVKKRQRLCQWAAIQAFAADLWNVPQTDADALRRLWVVLLYAIGNFKRQGNTVISPLQPPWRLAHGSPLAVLPRSDLSIPLTSGGTITLSRDTGIAPLPRGVSGFESVPTGSTLLAALWPTAHVIMDKRDYQSTVALMAHADAGVIAPNSQASLCLPPSWGEYRWFRCLIRSEASRLGVEMFELERALFVAFALCTSAGMTWAGWGGALLAHWP